MAQRTRRRKGGSGIKINPANKGKTRATTKKNKTGKLSIPDLKRQKARAVSTKRKQQLQFAILVRQGKFGGGGGKRR